MAKYTKYLFFLSVILSITTSFLMQNGEREIYPFYSWRLFGKPCGNSSNEIEYRLYAIKNSDIIRISNTSGVLFDGNQKAGFINKYGDLIAKHVNEKENKIKVARFAKCIEPQYDTFLLVQERFDGKDLMKPKFIIHTQIITQLYEL